MKSGKYNLTKRAEKILSRKNAEENCAAKNEGKKHDEREKLRGEKRGEKRVTKREKRENYGNKSGEKRDNQKRSGLARRKERELRKEKKPTVA